MTYRVGMDVFVADLLGEPAGPPHIRCDACGGVCSVTTRNGLPATWFIDGKSAPGWIMQRRADGTRADYCPTCKKKEAK